MMEVFSARTPFSPNEAGYSAERLDVLDGFFSKLIEEGKLQGAFYAMARNGKVFANRAMGKASFRPENDTPCKPDSIRMIASITKLFTACSVMKLVEDGSLLVTDPISNYIDEFKNDMHGGIQLWHLMTHTSGLAPDGNFFPHSYRVPYPISTWDIMLNKEHFKRNWIESFLSIPMIAKPGEQWLYSSMGYSVLAEIIQRVTGESVQDFVMKTFIEPLGMTDTSYVVPEEKWDRMVTVHEHEEIWTPREKWPGEPIPRGGSGLFSTAPDLLKFAMMLANDGEYEGKYILSRKAVEKLRTNALHNVKDFCFGCDWYHPYGLGVELKYGEAPLYNAAKYIGSPGVFGHGGAGYSLLMVDPKEKFSVVWFAPHVGWIPESDYNALNVVWSGIL